MAGEIELVSDGDGVVVAGDASAVQRFLEEAGLLLQAQEFDLSRLLKAGASTAEMVSGIVEQSALYLKLTPESAQRLKDAGGLMKTKTKGISHIMLGEPGKESLKWLQAENSPASLLTNPAVLSGVSGLLSQFAQQAEAQEFRALLARIEEKLDDERRARRNAQLARLRSAAAMLEGALKLLEAGGDPQTAFDKVSHLPDDITTVQETALIALGDIARKVKDQGGGHRLKRTVAEARGEVELQLAILARCFELSAECDVVELEYIARAKPERLDGHRTGLADTKETRRRQVLDRTRGLMKQLDAAARTANQRAILHSGIGRSVVIDLNETGDLVDAFHLPLGVRLDRSQVRAVARREALRDPEQRQVAAAELGKVVTRAAASAVLVIGAKAGWDKLNDSNDSA